VNIKRIWAAVCKRAGVAGVRPHDLRHFYATFAGSLGLGLGVVAKLLGHTQTKTTERYLHAQDKDVQAAGDLIAGQMQKLLTGTGE